MSGITPAGTQPQAADQATASDQAGASDQFDAAINQAYTAFKGHQAPYMETTLQSAINHKIAYEAGGDPQAALNSQELDPQAVLDAAQDLIAEHPGDRLFAKEVKAAVSQWTNPDTGQQLKL